MNELLSIIVPVYNVENYLPKCIESVINQKYSNFELLLVDDGSNDSSGMICDKYARLDKRIKVFHINNQGPGNARNIGLQNSNGTLITFLDSDDYVSKHYYINLIDELIEYNADVIQASYTKVFETLKYEEITFPNTFLENKVNICFEFFRKFYLDNYLWNKVFKSGVLKDCMFPDLFYSEDQYFLLKAFNNCNNVKVTSVNGYYHLIQKTSLCNSNFSLRRLDVFKSIELQEEFAIQNNIVGFEYLSVDACIKIINYFPYLDKDLKLKLKDKFDNYYMIYKNNVKPKYSNENTKHKNDNNKKALLYSAFYRFPSLISTLFKMLK